MDEEDIDYAVVDNICGFMCKELDLMTALLLYIYRFFLSQAT